MIKNVAEQIRKMRAAEIEQLAEELFRKDSKVAKALMRDLGIMAMENTKG